MTTTAQMIMDKAQEFAIATSMVCGPADDESAFELVKLRKLVLASMVEQVTQQREALLSELQSAHTIIRNANCLLMLNQRQIWASNNARDGVIAEGGYTDYTASERREALIKRVKGEPS